MVVIAGVLRNSGDQPIAKARLTIRLTDAIVDISDDPDSTLLPVAVQYMITNGALSLAQRVLDDGTLAAAAPIDLLPSSLFEVQYYFKLEQAIDVITTYLQDGTLYTGPYFLHTDSKYYTGSTYTAGVSQLLTRITTANYTVIDDFYVGIAASPTVQEYSLLRKSRLTSTLDDSLYLVMEQLTTNPLYVDRLSGKFNARGAYDAAAFYAKNDVVVSGSVLSVYVNASSTAGNAPPSNSGAADTAYWAKLPNLVVNPINQDYNSFVSKTGSTMTGALILPSLTGSPNAQSAVPLSDGDARYVRAANVAQSIDGTKTFIISPVLPDVSVGDNTLIAVPAKFVTQTARDLVIGLGVSGVGGTTPANRVVQTDPNAATPPTVFWAAESDTLNMFDPTTGIFTNNLGVTATFRVTCTLELQASAAFTGLPKLWLYTLGTAASPVTAGFSIDERYAVLATGNTIKLFGKYRFTLANNERFSIRVSASAANLVVNTNNNNQLTVRRAF